MIFYGRFLRIKTITVPTTAIAMIIATTPTAMYAIKSVVDAKFDLVVAVGATVGALSSEGRDDFVCACSSRKHVWIHQ